MSATLAENGIVLKLYFAKNTEPEKPEVKDVDYTVVHEYWIDGVLNASLIVRETISGKEGDIIAAESVEKKLTAGDALYAYTSASPESIVLVENAAANVITLRYDRTTGSGNDEDDDPTPTTPNGSNTPNAPEAEIPDENTPLTNLPDPEVPLENLPKTPEEVIELEEPEVPLADLPEESEQDEQEILDEETPLANVPKTGETEAAAVCRDQQTFPPKISRRTHAPRQPGGALLIGELLFAHGKQDAGFQLLWAGDRTLVFEIPLDSRAAYLVIGVLSQPSGQGVIGVANLVIRALVGDAGAKLGGLFSDIRAVLGHDSLRFHIHLLIRKFLAMI